MAKKAKNKQKLSDAESNGHVDISANDEKVKKYSPTKEKKKMDQSDSDKLRLKNDEKSASKKLAKKDKLLKKLKKKLDMSIDVIPDDPKLKKLLLKKLKKEGKIEKYQQKERKSVENESTEGESPKKNKQQTNNLESKEEDKLSKKKKRKLQESNDVKESANDEASVRTSKEKSSAEKESQTESSEVKESEGKRKKKKKSKHAKTEEVSEKSNEEKKAETEKVISTKKQNKFKKKRLEHIEDRKQIRQEEGQYYSANKLTVEEMKEKISEILSRETISKTAKRRLAVLNKKLSVALSQEGTVEQKEPIKRKSDVSEGSANEIKNKKLKKDEAAKVENNVDSKKSKKNKKGLKIINEVIIPGNFGGLKYSTSKGDEKNKNNINKKDSDKKPKKSEDEEIKKEISKLKEFIQMKNINQKEKKKTINGTNGDKSEKEDGEITEDEDGEIIDDEEKKNPNQNGKVKEKNRSEDKNVKDKFKYDSQQVKVQKEKNINKFQNNDDRQTPESKITRYVVFVGNLPYSITAVDIKKHFLTKVSKVKDIRIALDRQTNEPRGFAHVELENSTDYQKAISLNGTAINDRNIRVEHQIAPDKKKQYMLEKNKKLHNRLSKGRQFQKPFRGHSESHGNFRNKSS